MYALDAVAIWAFRFAAISGGVSTLCLVLKRKRIAIRLVAVSVALALAGFVAEYMWQHSFVLESKMTHRLKAEEIHGLTSTTVRITGFCGHSAMSVMQVSVDRDGTSMVVIVRLMPVMFGGDGSLAYDVQVPAGVNEVRFGREKVLIWKRE
jgi:hypothetical protein